MKKSKIKKSREYDATARFDGNEYCCLAGKEPWWSVDGDNWSYDAIYDPPVTEKIFNKMRIILLGGPRNGEVVY